MHDNTSNHKIVQEPKPQSQLLRGGRQSEATAAYFVTKAIEGRHKLFENAHNAQLIVDSLAYARTSEWLKLLAFCVMPDHYHLLFVLLCKKSLSDVVGSISKFTSARFIRNDGRCRQMWQEGFFDHRCRDVDDAIERINYIENNPIRAGLVDRPELWAYSSANPQWAGILDRKWYSDKT